MTAALGAYWSRAAALFRAAVRAWTGEDDYQRYLRGCAHQQQQPLDRGRYFAERLEERYRSASRCC